MAEKIKKHKSIVFILGTGLLFLIAGLMISGISGIIGFPDFAQAATTTKTVTVSATVQPWLYFSVNPTAIALTPDLLDVNGNVNIGSSTNVTFIVGTNSSGGWTIGVRGLYGGLGSTTANLIPSVPVAATTTIVAGTDGYGANATGSIAGVVVQGNGYAGWGSATVGAIPTSTSQLILSKSSANASSTVGLMKVYAACDSAQPVGTYEDTITLTLTSQ
jgi:hypothetical protein